MNAKSLLLALLCCLACLSCSDADGPIEPEDDMRRPRRPMMDDFEAKAARLRPKQAIPTVQTLVPARGPWTGNNNLGQSVQFQDNTAHRASILKMPEMGPPAMRTVHLGLDYDNEGSETFRIFAEVSLGAGGSEIEFTMDWHNGASFSAVCNAIEVVAKYDSGFSIGPTTRPLKLSAIVGEGGGFVGRPTYTPYTGLSITTGNTSAVLVIPPFARRVRIIEETAGAPAGNAYHASNYLIMYPYLVGASPRTQVVMGGDRGLWLNDGVPLAHGARKMTITNNSGSSIIVGVQFELDV